MTAKGRAPRSPKLVDLYDVAARLLALEEFARARGVGSLGVPSLMHLPRALFDEVPGRDEARIEGTYGPFWSKRWDVLRGEVILFCDDPPAVVAGKEAPV